MGQPVADVAAFLSGTWVVDRDIVDSLRGAAGTFIGSAKFAPDGDVLTWVEAGELQWVADVHRAPVTQKAGRRLLVAVQPCVPCVVDVAFDDGTFFHRADLSSGSDIFVHGCAPDIYRGTWTVSSPNRFQVTWDVEGPAKQLMIRSSYSRV
ncbi:MAG TPA: DUF6314 family protein [Acidothermaceae bacterium]|jgi:hypothetical protein